MPLQADIAVGDMMKKDQERYPERREELLDMLAVDPNWRMHQVGGKIGGGGDVGDDGDSDYDDYRDPYLCIQ